MTWTLTGDVLRAAQHLASEVMTPGMGKCDLTAAAEDKVKSDLAAHREDRGRCPHYVAAIRWEDGFADRVCEKHAQDAAQRGALVIYPKRHDGSLT